MRELDLETFVARAEEVDGAALRTPRIDGFCSSSAWIVPAHHAFHPVAVPWILQGADGFAPLAVDHADSVGRYVAPLEAMWGLASPLLSSDPVRLARDLAAKLLDQRRRWDTLWFSGLAMDSDAFRALVGAFGRRCRLGLGPQTVRHVASVDGGFEGWIERRSAKFRANIRRTVRRAEQEGITYSRLDRFEAQGAGQRLFDRILAVERRSWKGMSEQGIQSGAMLRFYQLMVAQLARDGRLRVVLARQGESDVAFCFGAVFGDTYRGLQMSFADEYRALGAGNLVQAEMIRWLGEDGVPEYDLGTDIPYKMRWSEPGLTTVALVVQKS